MKSTVTWRNVLGVLTTLLLLTSMAGCQQGPIVLPAEPIIPEGFTTYTEDAGLFSISYPNNWADAGMYRAGYENKIGTLTEVMETGLPLTRILLMFQVGHGTRFDSDPTVKVTVEPLPATDGSLNEIVEAEIRIRVNSRPGDPEYSEKELSRVTIMIDGREAIVRQYELTTSYIPYKGDKRLSKSRLIIQMTMRVGNVLWVVTGDTQKRARFNDALRDVVMSLRLSPTAVP